MTLCIGLAGTGCWADVTHARAVGAGGHHEITVVGEKRGEITATPDLAVASGE